MKNSKFKLEAEDFNLTFKKFQKAKKINLDKKITLETINIVKTNPNKVFKVKKPLTYMVNEKLNKQKI